MSRRNPNTPKNKSLNLPEVPTHQIILWPEVPTNKLTPNASTPKATFTPKATTPKVSMPKATTPKATTNARIQQITTKHDKLQKEMQRLERRMIKEQNRLNNTNSQSQKTQCAISGGVHKRTSKRKRTTRRNRTARLNIKR